MHGELARVHPAVVGLENAPILLTLIFGHQPPRLQIPAVMVICDLPGASFRNNHRRRFFGGGGGYYSCYLRAIRAGGSSRGWREQEHVSGPAGGGAQQPGVELARASPLGVEGLGAERR